MKKIVKISGKQTPCKNHIYIYIYFYIYIYICVCVYIYMYKHIYLFMGRQLQIKNESIRRENKQIKRDDPTQMILSIFERYNMEEEINKEKILKWFLSTEVYVFIDQKSVCRSRSNSQNRTWDNRPIPNQKRSRSRLYIVTLLT